MKVTIAGNEYEVRYSLRALFIFEAIAKKTFEVRTVTDVYVLYYSMLLAGSPDCGLAFDAFIDAFDADGSLSGLFGGYLDSVMSVNRQFSDGGASGGVKKKKTGR